MNLIIVESPTKARTFNRILKGKDYFVFATFGHIRDLPPQKTAIDYEKKFKPQYQLMPAKKKVIDQLKKLGSQNDQIILATDLDREGESIAYHAAYVLGFIKEHWPDFKISDEKNRLKRIVFHEITQHALDEALAHPGELRTDLVKAQQARRILDRIVGYELSPLLWKKTGKNWLSAGRVQTVALRLIVEREKEITKFQKEKYFQIYGFFKNGNELKSQLVKIRDADIEIRTTIQLFAGDYQYTKTTITDENAGNIQKDIESDSFIISDIKEEVIKRYPPPPLTTSLLQQEGFHRFSFSSKLVMKLAQDLYERGLITYHRTDSFNLSTQFVFRAKDFIEQKYGKEYALEKPRGYRTKSKMAQEAHEAIRPTHLDKDISEISDKKGLTVNHKKLYQLIFERAVATQMKEAEIKQIKVFIQGKKQYLFASDFQQVLFDGFLKVLNPEFVSKNLEAIKYEKNHEVMLKSLEVKENFTLPPPRYNEASLIKIMEERGIGRPSTYASIISLIQEKGYVEKDGRYFMPTQLGTGICDYLSSSFASIFEIGFTASMEEQLDDIAEAKKDTVSTLADFYAPFHDMLMKQKDNKQVLHIEEQVHESCPQCGSNLTLRYSKFGKFFACTAYPKCKFTKPFLRFVDNKKCPLCSGRIVVKYTKSKKRFYGCENYPKCNYSAWKLN